MTKAAKYQVKISSLRFFPDNPRNWPEHKRDRLKKSITEFSNTVPGWDPKRGYRLPESILVNRRNKTIVGGNFRTTMLLELGQDWIHEDDIRELDIADPTREKALNLALNSESLQGEWDVDRLLSWAEEMDPELLDASGWSMPEIEELFISNAPRPDPKEKKKRKYKQKNIKGSGDPATSKTGDLWLLGRHRLLCGDCSSEGDVKLLLDGKKPNLMFTDPPYCSGGFQEGRKHRGSIGSDAQAEMVVNDSLSTRGYIRLMREVLQLANAESAYIFTDWKMWCNLFDVSEGVGYSVRMMIVWDKGRPGMGKGWRSQHELILACSKVAAPFNATKPTTNVIQCARTGNKLHPTQKPVALLKSCISVLKQSSLIYDPFCGSGSILMAAQELGRSCYTMDIDPFYVDTTVKRYVAENDDRGVYLIRGGEKIPYLGAMV